MRRIGIHSQFTRFILVGGVAAAVNVGSRALFGLVLPFEIAVVAAFFVGLTSAFVLSRTYVFSRNAVRVYSGIVGQFWRFTLVNIAALPQTLVISLLILHFASKKGVPHAETLAHSIGVAVPVLTSFFGHRYFTFRQQSN